MTQDGGPTAGGIRSLFHGLIPHQFERWFLDVHRHLDGLSGDIGGLTRTLSDRLAGVERPLNALLPVLHQLQPLQARLAVNADLATEALMAATQTARRLERLLADGDQGSDPVATAEREAMLPLVCALAASLQPRRRAVVLGAKLRTIPVALAAMGHEAVAVHSGASLWPGLTSVAAPLVDSPMWPPQGPTLVVVLWDVERAAPLLSADILPIGGDVAPRVMAWLRTALPKGTDIILVVPSGPWDADLPGAVRDQSVTTLLGEWESVSSLEAHEQDGVWVPGPRPRELGRRVLAVHVHIPDE